MDRHEEWVRVERTPAFQEFSRKRKAFLIPATIFFLLFFFVFVFLAAFTTVLNGKVAGGPLTWAYVYGLAQFAMTWILTHIYVSQANKWDGLVDRAHREAAEEEGR